MTFRERPAPTTFIPGLVALALAFALAILAIGPSPARAQGVAAPRARTALVAESRGAAPGATVWVAVVQTLDKGWHTYWRNPGDAGEAATLTWTLPAGWRAGEVAWPAPERLPVGPIMNYGYEGQVVLPVPVQVPADARVGDQARLEARIDYLVCAEVCVPGQASVALTLPVVAGSPAPDPVWGPAIARALANAPDRGGLTAAFQRVGGRLRLAVTGDALAGAPDRDAYFYPYDETLIDHARPQALERGPRGLTLSLVPAAASGAAAPVRARGVLVADGKAHEVDAAAGPPPPGSGGLGAPRAAGPGGPGVLLAMGGAFLGGLVLNLMPCVFPILSMKAVALAGHGGEVGRARGQAAAFLLGVLASFLGLAGALIAARAAGAAIGWGFQLQSPLPVALLALVMLGAALNLSGLFEVGTSAQGLGSGLAARGDLAGSAFTGVLAVVVAAPCTAPFMGPALGFALTQAAPTALAVFLALGLGFAAPFTLLALSPTLIRRLPRPGPWMDALRKTLAFPMYAAAAWLVWVLAHMVTPDDLAPVLAGAVVAAFGAWLYGSAQRRMAIGRDGGAVALWGASLLALAGALALVAIDPYRPAATAAAAPAVASGELPSEPWNPARLAALRAARRPVLVNFTAAWCVTCQVNDRIAFSTGEVARALKRSGAVYMVGDWTRRDGAIAQALGEQGRIGVPLYLVYGIDGGAPTVLPQLLTPALVAQALDRAARPPA
jgi:thiol:disulfide interchange protein DsbD